MAKPVISINGFGRIGRLVARAAIEKGVEIAAINDLVAVETNAHLFKYDSVHGRFAGEVRVEDGSIVINGKKVKCTAEKDPAALKHDGAIVIESTGRFTKKEDASKHLTGGASKVIISAPANDADLTVVLGVNDDKLTGNEKVISNASCTTNCLAPVVKAINDKYGVVKGLVTTIHSYTNDQQLLDLAHKDLRRARAAAVSMIPSSTGAAKAIGLVIPELKGKLDGLAVRVPTPNVSLVDFVAELKSPVKKEDIQATLKAAAAGPMKGILEYTDEPLVSIDFNHHPASSIVDGQSTFVVDNMVKVLAWYDNEWGYSNRVVDLVIKIAK